MRQLFRNNWERLLAQDKLRKNELLSITRMQEVQVSHQAKRVDVQWLDMDGGKGSGTISKV